MPRTPTIRPKKDANRTKPWRVDIPPSLSPNGKRLRFFFSTKAEADIYAEEQRIRVKNFGVSGSAIMSPSTQEQASAALDLLKPYGVGILEVVNEWVQQRQASEASIPFEQAMDDFLAWRKRSDSYTRSIRQTKNRLEGLHGSLLNRITPADLTKELDRMTPSVRNFTIRILGGLFNFGIKRSYCADNPVQRVDRSQRVRTEIAIHHPSEVEAILRAAESHDGELVPFLAVSFFCGVRRSEALRLQWSHIDLHENFIKLPASITKTAKGRHIEISENCRAWLLPHSKTSGKIFPHSGNVLRDRQTTLRTHHEVTTIKHGPRHCFASYWLAEHNDINTLCRMLGHDDPETTFQHYAKAATKRDAALFWAIMPAAAVGNVININTEVAA